MAPTEWPESITFQTMPLRKRPCPGQCARSTASQDHVFSKLGQPGPNRSRSLSPGWSCSPAHVARKPCLETSHSLSQNHTERAQPYLRRRREWLRLPRSWGQRLSNKQPGQAGPWRSRGTPPCLVPGRFFLPLISLLHTRPASLPSMTPGLPTTPPKLIKCRVNFSPRISVLGMSQEARGMYWMTSIVSETLAYNSRWGGGLQDETFHSGYEYITHSYSCQSHQKFLSLGEKLNDDCSQENIV